MGTRILLIAMAAWCAAPALSDYNRDWVYELSGWALCAGCLHAGFGYWKQGFRLGLVPFWILAVVFNPIAPIHFGHEAWRVVNWIAVATFLAPCVVSPEWAEKARRHRRVLARSLVIVLAALGVGWGFVSLEALKREQAAREQAEAREQAAREQAAAREAKRRQELEVQQTIRRHMAMIENERREDELQEAVFKEAALEEARREEAARRQAAEK